jgi:hypothetical protein
MKLALRPALGPGCCRWWLGQWPARLPPVALPPVGARINICARSYGKFGGAREGCVCRSRGHAMGLGVAAEVTDRLSPSQFSVSQLGTAHSWLLPPAQGKRSSSASLPSRARPGWWLDRRRRHEVSCGFSLRRRGRCPPARPSGAFGLDRIERTNHQALDLLVQQPERWRIVKVYVRPYVG